MKKDEIVQGVDIKSWSLTQSGENGHKKNSLESKQIGLSLSIGDKRKEE